MAVNSSSIPTHLPVQLSPSSHPGRPSPAAVIIPRQHHSSGPPVAMNCKKATGGPPVAHRQQSEGGICH